MHLRAIKCYIARDGRPVVGAAVVSSGMVQIAVVVAGGANHRDTLADGVGYGPAVQGKPWYTEVNAKALSNIHFGFTKPCFFSECICVA